MTSGLVDVNGKPLGETPEQRVIREFGQFAQVANNSFRRIGSQRVAVALTFPNRVQMQAALVMVQRAPLVIEALRDMEERAKIKKQRAKEMHDFEIGSEAGGLNDAANLLRTALFGKGE